MTVERTAYEVAGWGVGELWMERGVVVAHDFAFDASVAGRGRVSSVDAQPDARQARSPSAVQGDLIERVRAFLEGKDARLGDATIDLDWCTEFQRDVLTVLRQVPRGEVVSYGELAALAGRPGAQRAVGTICATNRYAFFVPCHRVVGADGIGGYGSAGVEVKRRLLALEDVPL